MTRQDVVEALSRNIIAAPQAVAEPVKGRPAYGGKYGGLHKDIKLRESAAVMGDDTAPAERPAEGALPQSDSHPSRRDKYGLLQKWPAVAQSRLHTLLESVAARMMRRAI